MFILLSTYLCSLFEVVLYHWHYFVVLTRLAPPPPPNSYGTPPPPPPNNIALDPPLGCGLDDSTVKCSKIKKKSNKVTKARIVWPDKVVADLLEIYNDKRIQIDFTAGKKSHGVVWKDICKKLQGMNPGFPTTFTGCRDNFKTLRTRYLELKKST